MIENYEGLKDTFKELTETTEELFSKIDDLNESIQEEDKENIIEYTLKFGAS